MCVGLQPHVGMVAGTSESRSKNKGSNKGQLVTNGQRTAIGARVHAVQALAEHAVQVARHIGQRAVALQHILDRCQAPLRACRRTCFRAGSEQAQATEEPKD